MVGSQRLNGYGLVIINHWLKIQSTPMRKHVNIIVNVASCYIIYNISQAEMLKIEVV